MRRDGIVCDRSCGQRGGKLTAGHTLDNNAEFKIPFEFDCASASENVTRADDQIR
jgi:hypothetical protein